MAILVSTRVPSATREQAYGFDDSIERAMADRGGPPDGLMVHMTYPTESGFTLSNVWRSETEMRPFFDEVILPALATAELAHEAPTISPVWVFARP
jgi:hypothetical protein